MLSADVRETRDAIARERAQQALDEIPAILAGYKAVAHNGDMAEPLTRPELDAKLETIEARMDGRLARIEDRFASIDRQFSDLRSMLAEQKNTAWKAAGATIGVFVGVFAIYVAAFDSGRETSKVAADAQMKAAEAQAQTSAALAEIRQIVSDMKAQPPGPPAQR